MEVRWKWILFVEKMMEFASCITWKSDGILKISMIFPCNGICNFHHYLDHETFPFPSNFHTIYIIWK